jgi:hypothetical protein
MNFNDKWTNKDNKLYRKLIKEKKSIKEIISIIGYDKLKNMSSGHYQYGGIIKDFGKYLNEIVYSEKITDFIMNFQDSKFFEGEQDISYLFKSTDGTNYILDFIFYIDKIGPFTGKKLYNVSFTTKQQKEKIKDIEDYKEKCLIYEEPTNLNEVHEVIKRIIYLFNHFNKYFGKDIIYVIGESENEKKTEFYTKLIKDSISNVEEVKGESSINGGLPVFYYKIQNGKI